MCLSVKLGDYNEDVTKSLSLMMNKLNMCNTKIDACAFKDLNFMVFFL